MYISIFINISIHLSVCLSIYLSICVPRWPLLQRPRSRWTVLAGEGEPQHSPRENKRRKVGGNVWARKQGNDKKVPINTNHGVVRCEGKS